MTQKQVPLFFMILISFAFISCAQNSKKSSQNGEQVIHFISPQELQARLDTIQLIDIRTPQEFQSGHLENAVNINYFDADFLTKINQLDKSKEVYIYCRSGNRSNSAIRKLENSGFPKIYDLKGGILNWNKNKLKTVK
jgi:rhodanese-related sulfurtransferase